MYDFVKLAVHDKHFANNLLRNSLLRFNSFVDDQTYEKKFSIAKYHDLQFKVYKSGRVEIKGSLHKFKNQGRHNCDHFEYDSLIYVINELSDKFGLNPFIARLHNLEVGFNIITDFDPNRLISKLITFHSRSFADMRIPASGCGKIIEHQQYSIKIYNKGIQYGLSEKILRVEKRFLKMVNLEPGPIYLTDLLKRNFIIKCIDHLISMIDELIIDETINPALLNAREIKRHSSFQNPRYWETLKKQQRYKNKLLFAEIIQRTSVTNFRQFILDNIRKQGDHFLIKETF